jgi:peptidyl-prolyl cis-trans isomerase D
MAFGMRGGEIRGPLSTYRGHYFIELLERKDARLTPFDEAREDCRALVLSEMRSKLAFERASALARAAMAPDSLEGVAEAESLLVATADPFTRSGYIPGLGRDLTLVGAAFAASQGDPPFAVEGDRGSYVVRVDSAEKSDPAAFEREKADLARRISQQKRGLAYTAWIAALEKEADIKDFRESF